MMVEDGQGGKECAWVEGRGTRSRRALWAVVSTLVFTLRMMKSPRGVEHETISLPPVSLRSVPSLNLHLLS